MSNSLNQTRKADRRSRMQRPMDGPQTIQVIGDPMVVGAVPNVRTMTLEDIEDDCPICMEMRKQILAGNPPEVMVFE